MLIGLVKEIKNKECRVGLTPDGTKKLIEKGHHVYIEQQAGFGSGFSDQDYRQVGGIITSTEDAWDKDLIIKVKEPTLQELPYLKQQIIFTFFHLAGADRLLTETLLDQKTTALAYETLEDDEGKLPLLAPMSAIAGNMAVQVGCHYLSTNQGGKGVMLGSVLGKRHGKVLILGDGIVGSHAAITAIGLGAHVHVGCLSPKKGLRLKKEISNALDFFISEPQIIQEHLKDTDLLIGAILQRGARTACLVSEAMIKTMQQGSIIVDVSVDQGGCIETAKPTSHDEPVYEKHGIIHYCVTNMPAACPKTSTIVLTDKTLPYIVRLADHGLDILKQDHGLCKALNIYQGKITYQPVAKAFNLEGIYKAFPF